MTLAFSYKYFHTSILINGQTHWKIWRSEDGGKSFEERTRGKSGLDNDYPILISRNAQEIWGLWNKADGLQIEKIN